MISEEEAAAHGVELLYVNTASMEDPVQELMALTEGKGYDDVFVYIPNRAVCELGNRIMAYDGCMNLFAGPTDMNFSSMINLYDCHYSRSKIIGSTGGTIDDMKEAIEKEAKGLIKSAVMITHVGGLDSAAETTLNLPKIPGGKKLIYTHLSMPLTALSDFRIKGEETKDERYIALADIIDQNNGLWSPDAEEYLLQHFITE